MVSRKLILAGLVTSLAGFALPSFAQSIYIDVDPPARRMEKYENRPGQVWVPGNWAWQNGKYEWSNGRYIAERKGYAYAPDRWVRHDNDKWTYQRGGWNKDSDHDGTPDRIDRQPNNPNRK